jgi:hypothetical protein
MAVETSLTLAPLLPWPAIAVLGALATITVALGWLKRARGTGWRTVALIAVVAALANPTVSLEDREKLPDIAIVVVDDSASQDIGARRERSEAALEVIRQALEEADDLELRVVRVGGASGESAPARTGGTRLFEALSQALADVPRQRVAGIIMITDGQVHDVPEPANSFAPGGPLHVLITGERGETDRRLVIVEAPSYGIVGKPLERWLSYGIVAKPLEMKVRVEDEPGAGGGFARITLSRDGGPPEEFRVRLGLEAVIDFTLDHAGPTVLELEVEEGKQELTLDNNRAVVVVNGVRDRLRVLLVSGEPHPGERVWRSLLKADPAVDLIHFTILRPLESQDRTPANELSLISFPILELFQDKLYQYDLIIFDRYRRRGILPPEYLRNIAGYVEAGGALLTVVGPTYSTPSSLYYTPLGSVLPGTPTGRIYTQGFRPRVTDVGGRHPVTADLSDGGRPAWGRWFRQIEVEPARGMVLMTGVDGRPLLILDRVGEGRVAQLLSDHLWLWARGFEGGGPQAELLRRLAHWLMKEPELEENSLGATALGNQLEIVRRSLSPGPGAVEVTAPSGAVRSVELRPEGGGRATARITVDEAGLYRVSDGRLEALAAVGTLNPLEAAEVRATDERLGPIAEATGGAVLWLAETGPPDIRRVRPGRDLYGRDRIGPSAGPASPPVLSTLRSATEDGRSSLATEDGKASPEAAGFGPQAGGGGWIGLKVNGDYVVRGVKQTPLLPAGLILVLGLGGLILAWRREGS